MLTPGLATPARHATPSLTTCSGAGNTHRGNGRTASLLIHQTRGFTHLSASHYHSHAVRRPKACTWLHVTPSPPAPRTARPTTSRFSHPIRVNSTSWYGAVVGLQPHRSGTAVRKGRVTEQHEQGAPLGTHRAALLQDLHPTQGFVASLERQATRRRSIETARLRQAQRAVGGLPLCRAPRVRRLVIVVVLPYVGQVAVRELAHQHLSQ